MTNRLKSVSRAKNGSIDSQRDNSHGVATVERAADILIHFARTERCTLGVTEISASLGISKAAVHRTLSSLVSRDLIRLDHVTRRYSLGPMSMWLGLRCLERLDVWSLANPELRRLSATTNETATLSVRTGHVRSYVLQVTPPREVIMSVSIGVPFPLHAGASSKAFLAFLAPEEIAAYLTTAGGLAQLTPNTVTDVDALRQELSVIRSRGWARSDGERQRGAASVAAPVLDHHGLPVAVVSVCGPSERFNAEFRSCAAKLLDTTRRLSSTMGYRLDKSTRTQHVGAGGQHETPSKESARGGSGPRHVAR